MNRPIRVWRPVDKRLWRPYHFITDAGTALPANHRPDWATVAAWTARAIIKAQTTVNEKE